LTADYNPPAFALWGATPQLYQAVFTALGRHGLNPKSMQVDFANGHVMEQELRCSLLDYTTGFHVRSDRIELNCADLMRTPIVTVLEAAVAGLDAVHRIVPGEPGFSAFTLTLRLHGLLAGASARDFIATFSQRAPGGLGPMAGSSVSFYFGPAAEQLSASVTLDVSAVIEDGLFLQAYAVWDASRLGIDDLSGTVMDFRARVLAGLDLDREA
jgi:hypothetical protein